MKCVELGGASGVTRDGFDFKTIARFSVSSFACVLIGVITSGCAITIQNTPRNAPLEIGNVEKRIRGPANVVDEAIVALSFSGGGLRASAYAFGVLDGLEAMPGRTGRTLLDDLTFITSVSGGSITAAYYGLHGKPSLENFRERVLLRDGEAALRFSLWNPANIARLFAGGLNDRENLRAWLNDDVFKDATFADLFRRGKPDIWINATNVYHRLAFPFHERAFDALCSDLSQFPIAEAVYASMAVPIFFAPAVLEKHPESCRAPLPPWVNDALTSSKYPLAMKAIARAVTDFRSLDRGRYIKLIDGGVTDNFGLASIFQSRLALGTPYGPLTERDAVQVRRMLFVVVDAGQSPQGDWNRTVSGPNGIDLASAAIDTALDANTRTSYDAFVPMLRAWQDDIIRYRCGLTKVEIKSLGGKENFKCDDVKFTVTRVSFDDLGVERAAKLAAIPTRLKLPTEQVDQLIAAGRDSIQQSEIVKAFQRDLAIPFVSAVVR
jgi:NTE family protein